MKPLLKIAFLSIACFSCFCINNAAGSEDVIPGSQKIDRENSIINPIILTGIKKTDDIREEANKVNPELLIEVDGGIGEATIKQAYDAGVDVCVAGTAVFKADSATEAINNLKALCK